jgi:hypothetical protein
MIATRLVFFAVVVSAGLAAVAGGIPWLIALTPRWLARRTAIWLLWALFGVYSLAVPAVVVGCAWSWAAVARARRRGGRAAIPRAMRWVLLSSTCLVGLIVTEMSSATAVRWSYRIPELPTRFPADVRGRAHRTTSAGPGATERENSGTRRSDPASDAGLYVVVLGESSARGEPYQPWVSIGQIVGWQLERVFPGRRVTVDLRAEGGYTLGQAVPLLADLRRRPDAIILFVGHNEFQTRFGWPRTVRHYVEEGPGSPLALLELARSLSSTATLILKTLDGFYGEAPPPARGNRELVDHPICTPWEYESIRKDFEVWLDVYAGYCNRIGAQPIVIVPASNDGSFEPNRSVLAGSTPLQARTAFARAFLAARAAEATDPAAAIAAFRELIAQHPEFAESHFRLARLLARAGAWAEARRHFVLARDLDGSPARCPSAFRETLRRVVRRRGALLVDGPVLLEHLSPHGILDDQLFHDAHHLNLEGTIALAQDLLGQLRSRRAFGWPTAAAVPGLSAADCVRHFALDAAKLAKVCDRCANWFEGAAHLRYDPSERRDVSNQYRRAGYAIAAGRPLPATAPPSLGAFARISSARAE